MTTWMFFLIVLNLVAELFHLLNSSTYLYLWQWVTIVCVYNIDLPII